MGEGKFLNKAFVVIFIVLHKEVFSRMTEKIKGICKVMYNYADRIIFEMKGL